MAKQISLSLAGIWQPVDAAYITKDRNGALAGIQYASIELNKAGKSGIVVSGWSWGGSFGAGNTVTPVNMAIFAETADGLMQIATPNLISDPQTNGANSVAIADFNKDGREDIVLLAHNESPFIASSSTAYISDGDTAFKKISLADNVMAHDARVVNVDGLPTLFTRTYAPGQLNPVYTYSNGQFIEKLSAKLSVPDGSMSIAVSNTDALGSRFLALGDTGSPPNTPFSISVYNFVNGDISDAPKTITPYLSTKPEYANTVSHFGKNITHVYRLWTDDFNHDGKVDLLAGQSMWNTSGLYPSALQLLQNSGDLNFLDKTDTLNPDYLQNSEELDYSMQQIDLDSSGILSYLAAGTTFRSPADGKYHNERHTNYILLNDGTGRFHIAMHDQFIPMSSSVISFLTTSNELAAAGYLLNKDPAEQGVPRFLAYQLDNHHINFIAEVPVWKWLNQSTTDQIAQTGYAYVNVPIQYNPTIDYVTNISISDRNQSKLIRTFAGNDIIQDKNANSSAHIDGGLGIDRMIYSNRSASYSISNKEASFSVKGNLIDDLLVNVERLQFSDKVVALDIQGNAGQSYRLYKAALNRTPDEPGLAGWIKYYDQGGKLTSMAQMFIDSPEFIAKYGPLDNPGFINQLYRNVLNRDADSAGLQGWMDALQNGASRAHVLVGFSESVENQANVIGVIKNGIAYTELL